MKFGKFSVRLYFSSACILITFEVFEVLSCLIHRTAHHVCLYFDHREILAMGEIQTNLPLEFFIVIIIYLYQRIADVIFMFVICICANCILCCNLMQ